MSGLLVTGAMSGSGLVTGAGMKVAVRRMQHGARDRHAGLPVVEVGTALLFAVMTLRFGVSAELPAYLYLAAVGVSLALIEFDLHRLPEPVLLVSYVVTVVLLMPAGAASGDWHAAVRALAGMLALLALYFALALAYPNGLSFGDVKLAGLVGLYLGWLSWDALFITAIGGLVIACVGGATAIVMHHGSRRLAVPIAPCLVSAALLALFVTVPLSHWYASLLTA